MTELTLYELRLRLERHASQYPDREAASVLARLQASVLAFWDAERRYIHRPQALLGDVSAVPKIIGPPGAERLAVQDLGAEQFMCNTKADLRAILDAIARLSPAAPRLLRLGEEIIDVWADAEGALEEVDA